MATPPRKKSRAFAVYIGVLTLLLALAIALLIYAVANNGVQAPRLPGGARLARMVWGCLC